MSSQIPNILSLLRKAPSLKDGSIIPSVWLNPGSLIMHELMDDGSFERYAYVPVLQWNDSDGKFERRH